MNDELLEHLLYEEESDSLDFKSEQYRFVGALDEEKSELLKDILAFANSWCREDAFVLIGVKEVKGGRSQILGVVNHLDDADLQEFVNKKTQAPVFFSYKTKNTPEGTIGIIQIPRQTRPFYLKKNFGKLLKETVYVRRGSSTDVAKPDEIAKMGSAITSVDVPALDLNLLDVESKTVAKSMLARTRVVRYDPDDVPLYGDHTPDLLRLTSRFYDNREFYREYVEYEKNTALLRGYRIALRNMGSTLLSNVRVKLQTKSQHGLLVVDNDDYPSRPKPQTGTFVPDVENFHSPFIKRRAVRVRHSTDEIDIIAELLDVQPKDEVYSDDLVYFGGPTDGIIELSAVVFADNLSEPRNFQLDITVQNSPGQLDIPEFIRGLRI